MTEYYTTEFKLYSHADDTTHIFNKKDDVLNYLSTTEDDGQKFSLEYIYDHPSYGWDDTQCQDLLVDFPKGSNGEFEMNWTAWEMIELIELNSYQPHKVGTDICYYIV